MIHHSISATPCIQAGDNGPIAYRIRAARLEGGPGAADEMLTIPDLFAGMLCAWRDWNKAQTCPSFYNHPVTHTGAD